VNSSHPSLSKTQRLVILKLLFTGETPLQSGVTPELRPRERAQLIGAGLLRLEPSPDGRGKLLVLTDRAWEWASENLECELVVSKYATPALESVLRKLSAFLRTNTLTLSDFFRESEPDDSEPGGFPTVALPTRIRQAYLALSDGAYRQPVRLADLKAALSDVAPSREIDGALLRMQQAADLSLQTIEDPGQILAADHASAIRIMGDERHLVYLEK
jgi:hypothetical protein